MGNTTVPIEVEFTEGYEERFTLAILRIYEKRRQRTQGEECAV